jgi:multidrug efflux pump subunit AcrA (membrane-fusion protein)
MLNKVLAPILILFASCAQPEEEFVVRRIDITETVFAPGSVESSDYYHITAQTEGTITSIHAEEGDSVYAGQMLVTIDNPTSESSSAAANATWRIAASNLEKNAPAYREAEANLSFAEEKLEQDELQWKRMKDLYSQHAVSALEVENAELAVNASRATCQAQRERLLQIEQQAILNEITQSANRDSQKNGAAHNVIASAQNGLFIQLLKRPGDYVRKGDLIAKLSGRKPLIARLNLDETGIARIQLGQRVHILLNTDRDHPIQGTVTEISPQFDIPTQSFIVDVAFESAPSLNIVGTRLEANIDVESRNQVLMIPRRMLDYSNRVRVKGEKQLRTIQTGFKSTEWVEVIQGLQENEILLPHQH